MANKNTKTLCLIISCVVIAIFINACTYKPETAKPIESFNLDKYLGKWYEIARFDYKFEKNLDNVTAEYSLKENGNVKVLNKGYNYIKNKWESAEGKAKFRGEKNTAALKVSFFGPFYSGYNVVAIDDDYRFALVAGESLDYLWILSRETTIPENIKNQYLQIAKDIGYDTTKLVWVKHDKAK